METGDIAVIIVKGLSHEMTNVKTGELDHRREQQSCDGGGGGGASFKTVCHALHSTCHGKKHFH
jgi:hypothetical protein